MHDAERVLETRVHPARIEQVGPAELPDSAKSLKYRVVDDVAFPLGIRNKSVNGTPDLVRLIVLAQALTYDLAGG